MPDPTARPASPAGLARLRPTLTRSISPENPDGAVSGGALATEGTGAAAARDLGRGWKVSPSVNVPAGSTYTLGEIDEPGVITHLWITTHTDHWRTLVLRAYWDGSEEPAVEVPYGDFFCHGWGVFAQVDSQMIAANPHGGFNSYWPMPFREGARLTIENTSDADAIVYFQITYEVGGDHREDAYFHAQWRRSEPLTAGETHVLLEGVEGQGQYVGTYLAWGVNSPGWWGEGELKFSLDDDPADGSAPTIAGTGTEDYFGGAWNFDVPGEGYTAFTTPYLGMPQVIRPDGLYVSQQRFGLYRWHVADPIRFARGVPRVDVQALGWKSGWRYRQLHDDIASTALLYLDRPVTHRPPAPTFDAMEVFLGTGAGHHVATGPARPSTTGSDS